MAECLAWATFETYDDCVRVTHRSVRHLREHARLTAGLHTIAGNRRLCRAIGRYLQNMSMATMHLGATMAFARVEAQVRRDIYKTKYMPRTNWRAVRCLIEFASADLHQRQRQRVGRSNSPSEEEDLAGLTGNGTMVHGLLKAAIIEGRFGVLQFLLQNGAHVCSTLALHTAVMHGRPSYVPILVDSGAKVGSHNSNAMYLAIRSGNLRCVQALLDHGADIHDIDRPSYVSSFLGLAVSQGKADIVDFLVRTFSWSAEEMVHRGSTLLEFAAGEGWLPCENKIRLRILQSLAHLFPDQTDIDRAFCASVDSYDAEIVQFMVQLGADIYAYDRLAFRKAGNLKISVQALQVQKLLEELDSERKRMRQSN